MNAWKRIRRDAFTLAELIVVVSILAILATIGFLTLSGYSEDARHSAIAANVKTVTTAISAESAVSGNSPRYYVIHHSGAALSGAFVYVDGSQTALTGGDWSASGTNYSAGNPDYAKLKLNPEKFRTALAIPSISEAFAAYGPWLYDSKYLSVGAMESASTTPAGKKRLLSYFQVAGISPTGKAVISGNYPGTLSVSGSSVGLIYDPVSPNSTGALADGTTTSNADVSYAVGTTQTGTCTGLPTNAVWNTASSIVQTWNGSSWAPTTAGTYDTASSTGSCNFKCATGYAWNSQTSTCQTGFVQISAGSNHACGITSAGGAKCWGYNYYGQVGGGTVSLSVAVPTDVVGLSSGVTKIVARWDVTCAIHNGAAKCWGYNPYGELGNGTTTNSATPVQVSGLTSGVTDITNGFYNSCAVHNGAAKCWGYNGYGGLGDGTTTNSSVPVQVSGLASGVSKIASNYYASCAILSTGALKCWGYNNYGGLGNGTTTYSSTPVQVTGLTSNVTDVSMGTYAVCAVHNGAAKCWGYNFYGNLGNGTTVNTTTPTQVSGMASGISQISVGHYHACAIDTGGNAKCWGYNSAWALGDGSVADRYSPVAVSGLPAGQTQISAGGNFTCSISNGIVNCWGYNGWNQLAMGPNTYGLVPVGISNFVGLDSIAIGNPFNCAVQSGAAKCWGFNGYGSLWDGTNALRTTPATVSGLTSGVTKISGGNHYACAVQSGAAKCWGNNPNGGLGNGTTTSSNVPVQVLGLTSGVTEISTYLNTTCATHNGAAKCWGYNPYGGLGDGTTVDKASPVQVSGLTSGVTHTTVGYYHSCAIHSWSAKCWGYNGYGWLGDGTSTNNHSPVQVSGLTSGVTSISAGVYHTCAIHNGAVKCWGYNNYGGLGNGATAYSTSPVQVTGLTSGYVQVAVGNYHSCALNSSGGVKCWGYGFVGALGNGSFADQTVPVDVTGLSSGVTQISVNASTSCALLSDGSAKCWGTGGWGQFGNGGTFHYPTPQTIPL